MGELLLTATVIALHCFWFWYWSKGWKYRELTLYRAGESRSQVDLQIYARTMGEMAILTMSFLTIPIARNNIWESVFGVPHIRCVR